jgi:DNA ligase (NAD+)
METLKKLNNNSSKNVTRKRMASYKHLTENPVTYMETHDNAKLAKLLKEASAQYYKGTPVISDDIFDILKNYLTEHDPSNPALQEIGAPVHGEKVKLPYYMGSLDKIREDEAALEKWKSKHEGKVVVSDKLDGNSAMLVYSPKGIKMYSRGDGLMGQDISQLIPLIQGIPKKTDFPHYTVRGELIISKELWKTKGKGANARNTVAGVMNSKHPDKELASIIDFVAYEQLQPRASASDGFEVMTEFGFKVAYNTSMNTSTLTMDSLSKILMERRSESPYEIDGIVVFHDDDHNQVSGKNPSYGFAFKSILTHEEAEVVVKEVVWNASKDGYLKPLIHFDPVVLAGASIQKATGFNAQYIETHTIGPGSRIVIIRSGDVIPHIVRTLTKSSSEKPSFPDVAYEWNDTHVDIMLKDKSKSDDVITKRMTYFVKTLQMKGVGEGVVERLYKNGITTIKKLLNVTVEELIKMEGFQKKSAEKVVSEIRDSVAKADCLTFMDASNLFGRTIGEKKLKLIVSKFPKILEGYKPTEAELSSVDGIGSVTAKQFLDGLPDFFEFMDDIGIPCTQLKVATPSPVSSKPSLAHLTVVFTGMRDKDLEAELESRGGKVGSSVSKKTSLVVAKDPSDETGKVKSAKELGVKVVDFDTFKKTYI